MVRLGVRRERSSPSPARTACTRARRGHYAGDTATDLTLGLTHGHGLVVVFRASVDTTCASTAARDSKNLAAALCTLTESSVLLHECGHLFGLVNDGTKMSAPHQDAPHGAHDTNTQCIMYYLAERSSVGSLMLDRLEKGSTAPSPFDADCLADLAAAQK